MGHEPKPRTDEELAYLETLTVLVDEGRVFSPTGYEYCTPDPFGNRVQVYTPYGNVRRYHVVWWKAKGYWPAMMIDHKDRVPYHDWIDNLREATEDVQASNRNPRGPLSPIVVRLRYVG